MNLVINIVCSDNFNPNPQLRGGVGWRIDKRRAIEVEAGIMIYLARLLGLLFLLHIAYYIDPSSL